MNRSDKYRAAQSERQRQKNALARAPYSHTHSMANMWNDATWKAVNTQNGTGTIITGGSGVTFYPNGTTTPSTPYNTTFYPAAPAPLSDYDVERIALKVVELLATQPEGDIDAALKKWRKEHIG